MGLTGSGLGLMIFHKTGPRTHRLFTVPYFCVRSSRYSASCLPLMAAILIFKCTEGAGVGNYSFLPNRPRPPPSSFHTHTRRQPVTQSPRSRRSYGKIEDCEESRGRTVTICNKIAAFFVVVAAGL